MKRPRAKAQKSDDRLRLTFALSLLNGNTHFLRPELMRTQLEALPAEMMRLLDGGPSRDRTGTVQAPRDFKSLASPYSAIGPKIVYILTPEGLILKAFSGIVHAMV